MSAHIDSLTQAVSSVHDLAPQLLECKAGIDLLAHFPLPHQQGTPPTHPYPSCGPILLLPRWQPTKSGVTCDRATHNMHKSIAFEMSRRRGWNSQRYTLKVITPQALRRESKTR